MTVNIAAPFDNVKLDYEITMRENRYAFDDDATTSRPMQQEEWYY